MATERALWNRQDIPHKGWSLLEVEDLGDVLSICEMCCTQEIRYVHHMTHPDCSAVVEAGCVCAEHMSGDYSGHRKAESDLKRLANKRRTFANSPRWKKNASGKTVYRHGDCTATVFAVETGCKLAYQGRFFGPFPTEARAKSCAAKLVYPAATKERF